jgi:hypothetical protein
MTAAHRTLLRCADATGRLLAAAEAGELDALAALLDERAAALDALARDGAGALDVGLLACVCQQGNEALARLERRRDAVQTELGSLRAARPAVRRSQREPAPQLLSRRV